MTARPGDETNETDDPHAGREHVLEALKAAFAQGRLGKDEFVQRVGQALAAYRELDELTADIPATRPTAPSAAEPPQVTREAYNRGLVAAPSAGRAGSCSSP